MAHSIAQLQGDWVQLHEHRFREEQFWRRTLHRNQPTITLHLTSRYYHPYEDRYLTIREAASIQSFPLNFSFQGTKSAKWKQIGNAVPPLLGKALGKSILLMAEEESEQKYWNRTQSIHS